MKKILLYLTIISINITLFSQAWNISISRSFERITDYIIEDINNDSIDEIIISYYAAGEKFVEVYNIINGNLMQTDIIKVPYWTVFFDIGDINNNGKYDIVFLTSEGLYYREIRNSLKQNEENLTFIKHIKSEIMVPQPELLKDVNMIIDLDGDGLNELVIENIRAIEIYETNSFKKTGSIDLKTILEYALIPGQFYPHYIFYTLPIIQIKDIDNDNKKEIITKFPSTINIYSLNNSNEWKEKNKIYIGSDNVYFLSSSYIKFAFPVITDINNDNIKEIVVADANMDMPRLRFEAIGNIFYLNNNDFKPDRNKRIVVKGIPLNLPSFFNISSNKYKDFILPVVPFNLISIFGFLSGSGSIKVPFLLVKQNENNFDISNPKKLFEIQVRIENITSFVEELPLDQFANNVYPDFYYFTHNFKDKRVDIINYSYDNKKGAYKSLIIKTIYIPQYRRELPATLKLGKFTKNIKKDVIYITHRNFYVLTRLY